MVRSPPDLTTPAQFLKGVGPQRAELLAKLGLRTARDIVFFFPRTYQDLTELAPIRELKEGPIFRVLGTVEEIDLRDSGGGRSMVGVLLRQDHDYLRAVWFNQPFIAKQFRQGQSVVFTGTAKLRGFRWEMHHPRVETMVGEELPVGGLQPVYPLTDGITQYQMKALVAATVEQFVDEVSEAFPPELLRRYDICPIGEALRDIHAPRDQGSLQRARYRLVYQELFTMQLALALRQVELTEGSSIALPLDGRLDARIQRLMPFELTAGQQSVIAEITADMAKTRPMNRLLQGDVGSGKTMVAAYASLVAIANQCQCVLMAPTEILAEQHFDTLSGLLRNSKVSVVLLTGSLSAAQRREVLRQISTGEANLVVGTHAITHEAVQFKRLGLAVIDEQHRFGVKQRARLRQGDLEPHYLVMTATPIPRTVAMTIFGDLEVSTLTQMPPGRQPVHSYVGTAARRQDWWEFVRKKLREGQQAYVIAPLVDETDGAALTSVQSQYESLASEVLADFHVDLLHGRLPAAKKQLAMDNFRRGETQVLVATSLVEVGLDVPNANLMTIENAERFGLAQLHQLRGRVGRGNFPGFVCVYSPSDSPDVRQRLEAFVSTSDGFELAEIDFRLRGPGDLFGTKQHGLPPLRIADLRTDLEILQTARSEARQLLAVDPQLADPALTELRERVMRRYGKSLELGDVG